MAQQFLQAAQVGAAGEQVRRETVSQRVRRRAFGKPERAPRRTDACADHAGLERRAARTEEQRRILRDRPRTGVGIARHRTRHRGQDRNDARLVPLAGDAQRIAERQHGAGQRQRLADAQPRAIEHQQQRKIARADPGLAGVVLDILRKLHRFGGRDRAWQPLLHAWSAHLRHAGVRSANETQKPAQRAEFARRRSIAQPVGAAVGQIGTQIVRGQRLQRPRIDRAAPIVRQKGAKPLRRRDIGAARMLRPALLMRQMGVPVADQSVSQTRFRAYNSVRVERSRDTPMASARPGGISTSLDASGVGRG